MNTQHTPGPWKVSHNAAKQMGGWKTNPYSIVVPVKGVSRTTVANIPDRQTISEEQKRANAFLIAAAPDLLEALETLVNMAESFPSEMHKDHPDVVDARAAINKATGAA